MSNPVQLKLVPPNTDKVSCCLCGKTWDVDEIAKMKETVLANTVLYSFEKNVWGPLCLECFRKHNITTHWHSIAIIPDDFAEVLGRLIKAVRKERE